MTSNGKAVIGVAVKNYTGHQEALKPYKQPLKRKLLPQRSFQVFVAEDPEALWFLYDQGQNITIVAQVTVREEMWIQGILW